MRQIGIPLFSKSWISERIRQIIIDPEITSSYIIYVNVDISMDIGIDYITVKKTVESHLDLDIKLHTHRQVERVNALK